MWILFLRRHYDLQAVVLLLLKHLIAKWGIAEIQAVRDNERWINLSVTCHLLYPLFENLVYRKTAGIWCEQLLAPFVIDDSSRKFEQIAHRRVWMEPVPRRQVSFTALAELLEENGVSKIDSVRERIERKALSCVKTSGAITSV